MSQLIYLADDDSALLDVFSTFLEGAGYDVRAFPTGDALAEAFAERAADLVILDVMMPGTDGLTICRDLRAVSSVPIVILTAKDSEMDYLRGLGLGADDYLTKPFSPAMLVVRVRALLRRVELDRAAHEPGAAPTELAFADVTLSEAAHEVRVSGAPIDLTMTEFALLACLLKAKGQPVSRDRLLSEVWGIDAVVETRVTDETVRRVRAKLRAATSRVGIKAVWGYGYRLEDSDAHAD